MLSPCALEWGIPMPTNNQPTLGLNQLVLLEGIYPGQDPDPRSEDPGLLDYLATIRSFAGIFAPDGTAFAQGQTLSIAQNTAVFSVLGTTYGGMARQHLRCPTCAGG